MKKNNAWRLMDAQASLLIALVMGGAVQVGAQTIIDDDFESYADQAAFEDPFAGGWADVSGPVGNEGLTLSTERNFVPSGGTKSVKQSVSNQRSSKPFPTGTEFTADSQVHAKVTFYIFATNAPTGTTGPSRVQAGVTTAGNGSPTTLGWLNNAVYPGQTFSNTLFQGRCDYGPSAIGSYFNLTNAGTPTRAQSVNKWIKFDIERLTTGVTRYYVNDILGIEIQSTNGAWGAGVIGFNAGSQLGDSWYDGFSIVTNHPHVTTQPASQYVALGGNATFSVVANNATTYQWRKNVTNDIPGATSSSYTINNVQASDVGFYSVVVGNANGVIGTRAAQLVIGPPSIQSQTTNVAVLQDGYLRASVTAGGAPTLAYQWYKDGSLISGAITNPYNKTPFTGADIGSYTCIVTNTFGRATSGPVNVTMITNLYPNAVTPLWTKLPGAFPWLTASGSATRSLGYNALSNQVLIATRTGTTNIQVLNGDTGNFLYSLAGSDNFVGGYYPINKVGVTEDGVVYVANLTLNGSTANYKIYRYVNTDPATMPETVYDGDPGAGTGERWGDSFSVRGTGNSTQILIASRNGTNAVVFTTTDGTTWTPNLIACNVKPNDIGSSAVFGTGDTFYAKCNDSTNGLFRIGFNLGTGVGTVLNVFPSVPQAVTSIGVNKENCFLLANEFTTMDAARFYDVSSNATDPVLVDWAFYTARNGGFGAGDLVFYKDRAYTIEDNNGIMAMQINWPVISFVAEGSDLIMDWVGTYTLKSATSLTGSFGPVPGPVTEGPYTNSAGPIKFFRLQY